MKLLIENFLLVQFLIVWTLHTWMNGGTTQTPLDEDRREQLEHFLIVLLIITLMTPIYAFLFYDADSLLKVVQRAR